MGLEKTRSLANLSLVVVCGLVLFMADMPLAQQDRRITRKQEKRVALVIGNGAYKSSPLRNPVNDATDMAAALKRCNFTVMKKTNATRPEMRGAIREFGNKIKRGGIGLFYYAGHGIQVNGENYLVPLGAKVQMEDEVPDECLMVSSVLRKMETAGNRLNIIILDACRDNPFGRSFRSTNRGLAKMDAPTGSILAYATAPGSIAADGPYRNGLYTSKLLKHMLTPGLEIGQLFRQVRIAVVNTTGKRQVPWESSSLMGNFYFVPRQSSSVVASVPTQTPVSRPEVVGRDGNFEKYASGVVRDTKTGLEWLAGPNKGMSWEQARDWVQGLKIAGGGWRLPTMDELKTLNDESKRESAPYITQLLETTGWYVWSGETEGMASVWDFHFNRGLRDSSYRNYIYPKIRAFAVRSR